jgi:hypothetical protein
VAGKSLDEFMTDQQLRWAVERAVEIIEASRRVPEELKAATLPSRGGAWPMSVTSCGTVTTWSYRPGSGRSRRFISDR